MEKEEILHIRDTYFDSGEKRFFEELIESDFDEEYLQYGLQRNSRKYLIEKAMKDINRMEYGNIDEAEAEETERRITHLLAAIDDADEPERTHVML